MNYFSSLNELTGLAPTDDLVRFLRSEVKVAAECGGKLIGVELVSTSLLMDVFNVTSHSTDVINRQHCAQRKVPVIYSEADFEDFRPAGATRCTDGGEIWHGGGDRRSPPPCQISPPSVQR